MNVNFFKIFFVQITLFYTLPIFAAPAINTKFEFYDIKPDSVYDLANEIENNTPIKFGKTRFHARTSWQVKWKYKWRKQQGICYITGNITSLDISYTMPRISLNYDVSGRVNTVFNHYYNALFKHEQGHYDWGLLAANEVEKKLLNFGSSTDCQNLDMNVKHAIEKIIEKYKKRDADYDKVSDHGRSQGVSLKKFISMFE